MKLDKIIAVRPNKTIYRDGDTAIKVFDESYSKANILNEALNHAKIEETGINIPKIIEVAKIDGRWAIAMDYIEGETLGEKMEKDPENIEKYIDMFVEIQLSIHEKRAPNLIKLKDKMRDKISNAHAIDATTRYELHTRLEGMPKHNKVCHGDLQPDDIIITSDGTPYILDWAHATQGNASADAARTYLLFNLHGKKEIGDIYLRKFCKKSDTAKQYVQKWMPIVAASQSVKGKEEEMALLLSWVDVVDYE